MEKNKLEATLVRWYYLLDDIIIAEFLLHNLDTSKTLKYIDFTIKLCDENENILSVQTKSKIINLYPNSEKGLELRLYSCPPNVDGLIVSLHSYYKN